MSSFGFVRDAVLIVIAIVATLTFIPGETTQAPVFQTPTETPQAQPLPLPQPETPPQIERPKSPTTPTPPPATKKPIPPAPPEPPKTPKVEELNITLERAIQSISTLATTQPASTTNDRVRAALVNIICTTKTAGPFESISGSGIIIDPRGVILTNAHVAQFYLLENYPTPGFVECVIRTGSPARPMYRAELMFLPPSWIRDNAHKIALENPTGNGERDYALLRITGAAGPTIVLPSLFPFLLVATSPPEIGDSVLQAGYAAGFLGGITVQKDLFASSAFSTVRDVFTYNANTVDLFSLGGSVVAQQGSSGGPVTNTDGVLMGVIATYSGSGDTSTRDLHAVTTAYIIRDFAEERGKSLQAVLSNENLANEVIIFNQLYAPAERAALIAALEK